MALPQAGYLIKPGWRTSREIKDLNTAIAKLIATESSYGIRDLHLKVEAVAKLTQEDKTKRLLQGYFPDASFHLIKAIYFDKNQDSNWAVPWHQDKTIAVKQRFELPGYSHWTVKQGVPHVQPPVQVLQQIVTIRIALDPCNETNGALKIIPNSHQQGILTPRQITETVREKCATVCNLSCGDVLVMSPLLLHASDKALNPSNRRTIHLEYCSYPLPSYALRH